VITHLIESSIDQPTKCCHRKLEELPEGDRVTASGLRCDCPDLEDTEPTRSAGQKSKRRKANHRRARRHALETNPDVWL
jgi:hypothetical protein